MSETTYDYVGQIETVTLGPGTYEITAIGAEGGGTSGPATEAGGLGAEVDATFTFTQTTTIEVLVGGAGGAGHNGGGGGGGGGSFVYEVSGDDPNTLLEAAGGGGGAGDSKAGTNGQTVITGASAGAGAKGTGGAANGAGAGGTGGSGGSPDSYSPSIGGGGGGGGGFAGNAQSASHGAGGGFSFINGGAGGTATTPGGAGGFGGGGGGGGGQGSGGGGGGYSGGGAGGANGAGGGGGSYVDSSATDPTAVVTTDTGNGSVIIEETNCFMPGTAILTAEGEVAVEELRIGDLVVTADGAALPVRWIGRSTVSTRFADPLRVLPIRIRTGALADGLPARDLLLSPGHALRVDDILADASALVNGVSILRETDVPEVFTYYHVELDCHVLLIAEGVPTESFVDNASRMSFDNWAEHEALYGYAPIAEMSLPRAQSYRQVPGRIHARLMARVEGQQSQISAAA